ncbi:hypothetical protein [Streptomyces lydicamycinicus]|uniref:hypothetical protein n=1 Tax=Streptomyces lydicamycinicus TaxID=1546107 RepID=UPI003C2F5B5C
MATQQPVEGRCVRCKQPRPLFPYKPLHNCVETAGRVDLAEAAEWIAEIESNGDRWCEALIARRPRLMCVRCCDREAADEQQFIDEMKL